MTHAFFKALLFLGAGSVIIAMHHEQDMRNLGGLRKCVPITWIILLGGWLALIGTPFSPDSSRRTRSSRRCTSAICRCGVRVFLRSPAGVFVTALYRFRMYS